MAEGKEVELITTKGKATENNAREERMIKHVVMFKLKDEAEGEPKSETIEKLRAKLELLEEQISEVLNLEVGSNISGQPSAFDLVLYTEFKNLADLEIYRDHPEHKKVVDYIGVVCDARTVVDYIV